MGLHKSYHISQHAQGTAEWLNDRLGVITGTSVRQLITPTGRAVEGKAFESLCRLKAAERVFKTSDPVVNNYWTDRGSRLEQYARAVYVMKYGKSVVEAGLIYSDKSKVFGASVDGLLLDEQGMIEHTVEIKCLNLANHTAILVGRNCPSEHKAQIQAGLLVTGAPGCVFIAYHPDAGFFSTPVERDEKYISTIRDAVERALTRITEIELILRGRNL